MGDVKSNVASLMKNYEGVHYVSACDEYSSALFPKNPNAPTYFTGALVSRVHKGMDIDKPYLTLREIVDDISDDFKGRKNMPCPQQSCVLNADMMPFALNAINKDFSNHYVATAVKTQTEVSESEWKKTVKANTLAAYYEYVEKFPKSPYKKVAQNKIVELEEDEKWSQTEILGTPLAYSNYVKAYPLGKYLSKANAKIYEFKRFKEDNDMWASVCNIDTLGKYQDYLRIFPKGCHVDEAYAKIKELSVSIKSKRKFFALFFTLLIVLFMIPQNSDNGNYCNSVSDTFAVRTIKKDTNKNHVVDTYNNSDFNKASKEQQADKILEAKDEMHFGAALQLYEQALSENPDNEQILRKIADLKKLINEKYDYYMVRAEVFAKADCGSDDATRYYGMALRLKPGDLKASQGIESLKVKGK
jgi:tetratricopeptide (TPR) repeat protein